MATPVIEETISAADLAASVLSEEVEAPVEATRKVVRTDAELGALSGGTTKSGKLNRGSITLLMCLCGLNFLDNVDNVSFGILGPNIQKSLHLSDTGLGAVSGVSGVLVVVAAVPLGYAADRYRRTLLAGLAGLVAGIFTLGSGLVTAVWQLVIVRILGGAGKAAITPVHSALISDGYALDRRARTFAIHGLAGTLSGTVGPLIAAGLAGLAGGSEGWRLPFIVCGMAVAALAVWTLIQREPGRGTQERMVVIGDTAETIEEDPPIPFGAGVQRLLGIQTFYFILLGVGILGFALVGAPTFFNLLLERSYHQGINGRAAIASITSIGAIGGIVIGGVFGDRLLKRNPTAALLILAGAIAAFGAVFIGSLYLPNLTLVVIGNIIAQAVIYTAIVPVNTFVAAVVPYQLRALGFSLIGIYIFLLGGFLGGILIGSISGGKDGTRYALSVVIPPACAIAAALVAYGSRHVRTDMSLVVEDLREQEQQREELRVALEAGDELPLLQVRNIDFSYGKVQVLFDCSIEVRRGEVLALLGTNGAGKSTLLKVITGLGLPSRGVVRLGGTTITYLDPEDRVARGIVQLPGGKAIFPTMTVGQNLQAGAYSFIWDKERFQTKVAEVLELFPKLVGKLDQPAGTMSGGEQQQLALAKALLLDPKILCIDELSLGLAPVIVQDLIAIVQKLRERGLTMVIVEQSLNVALSISDRAIFMEKGQVKFQGPAQELMERDDLVRAVFLGTGTGG